jgi:branched-chain amino acid transport system substrate-binding protein
MRRPTRTTVVVAPIIVAALLLAACDSDEESGGGTTSPPATTAAATSTTVVPSTGALVFGLLGPGAGLLSELAIAQRNAVLLAIDDINSGGGVLDDQAAGVYAEEAAEGSAKGALAALLEQGADAILGPVSSSSAGQILPDLVDDQTLACSGSATLPSLTEDGTATGSFVRTALSDQSTISYVGDQLVARLQDQPGAPIAIVARDDDYGRSISSGLASTLKGRGFNPTVIAYNPQQVIFTNEVQQTVALKPALTVMVTYEETPRLLDTLINGGVPAGQIVGLDGAFTPRLAQQTFPDSPERVDGVIVMGSTGSRAFIDRLVQQPGQQVIYGAQAYDCAVAMALAAQAAGSADPKVFAAKLAEVTGGGRVCSTYADCLTQLKSGEDIDYDGPSGKIALDAAGDPTSGRFTTASFAGGQLAEGNSTDIDLNALAADVAKQDAITSAAFTASIQQVLRLLGYYTGPVDGIYDDDVAAAVKALQTDLGLPATGQWDEATDQAVRTKYGSVTEAIANATVSLQIELTRLGYYDGPVDGRYTREVVDAVKALQADLGVPPTGILDAATVQAAFERGAASVPPPPSTTAAPTTAAPPPTTAAPPTEAPSTEPPPTEAPPPPTTVPIGTILDVMKADPDLSEFVKLIGQAGATLADLVSGVQQATVFAPTNAAITAAGGAIPSDPGELANLLAYHAIVGRFSASDLVHPPGTHPTLAAGAPTITATGGGGGYQVNGANVVQADIAASNGFVNKIDQVLVPPG